jgi:hypothetical protein
MNIYLIILLSYVAFIFLMGVVGLKIAYGKIRSFTDFIVIVAVSLLWLAIIPVGIFIWPIFLYKILVDDKWTVEKTFTIHPLTEENKITLRQIGFEEGRFVSHSNIDYEGFRYGYGRIIVCNDGRVCIWCGDVKNKKHLIEIIKNLPNEPKEEQTTEQ